MLEQELLKKPDTGISLGNGMYKIRLKIKGKNKGKSGGARVISHVETELIGIMSVAENETVVSLLSIYDKADVENITDKELKRLLENIKGK